MAVDVLTEQPNTSTLTHFTQQGSILADDSQKNIATISSIETNSTSSQRIIEDSIKIFAQQLQTEWKRLRAPQGLREKLLETRTSEATVTARIFLDYGGFKAWMAYFLATEGKVHFKGRHDRIITIAEFQKLCVDDRINAARRVAGIQPHPTFSNAIHNISEALTRGRLLVAPPKSNEEAQQTSTAFPAISASSMNAPPPNKTQSEPAATFEISLNNPNFTTTQEQRVIEKASLQGIAAVFDEYMCGAIRRVTVQSGATTSSKAAVTMDFPPWGLVDCLMSLEVHQSKVGYLAMALFKVRVESVGQVRYVSLKEGVRLTPNPEITLKGVLDEAIIDVFGSEIHRAISTCRMRKKELEEGKRVTECVSMILTGNPSEGAIISLSLGLEGGVQIQNKLYT